MGWDLAQLSLGPQRAGGIANSVTVPGCAPGEGEPGAPAAMAALCTPISPRPGTASSELGAVWGGQGSAGVQPLPAGSCGTCAGLAGCLALGRAHAETLPLLEAPAQPLVPARTHGDPRGWGSQPWVSHPRSALSVTLICSVCDSHSRVLSMCVQLPTACRGLLGPPSW